MERKPSSEKHDSSLVAKAEQKTKDALTVIWDEIPQWMRDNRYVTTGYRQESNSYWKSAGSIIHLHNETVNIWTHLLGAILAGITAMVMYNATRRRFEMATLEDIMVFSCFFVGAVACLGMSATYHTLMNHSQFVATLGQRLDHIGIVCLIWGSFIPCIYYGFIAEPGLIRLYWTMITTFGAITLAMIALPKFRTPDWRPFRAFMYVAMGLSAVVPVIHGIKIYGVKQLELQMGLSYVVSQGILYIVGAGMYAARIPEKWYPARFDIWGASHQLFHILVVLAAATHFVGLLKAFDYDHSFRSTIFASYEKARKLGGP